MRPICWSTLLVALSLILLPAVNTPAQDKPSLLRKVSLVQRVGQHIPLETTFIDESGSPVLLRSFFQDKPVVLIPIYFECPMLCSLELNSLTKSLRELTLTSGKDYDVVAISFDPKDTALVARRKLDVYLSWYGRPEGRHGWHFLTGRESMVRAVTDAMGFYYQFDPASGQFFHPSAIAVTTPDGKIVRYLLGLEYPPALLRWTLIEAAAGRIGNPVDQFVLYCLHYDLSKARYTVPITNALRLVSVCIVAVVTLFVLPVSRRLPLRTDSRKMQQDE